MNATACVNVRSDWGHGYVVQGETPLHIAARCGGKEIIEFLLDTSADKAMKTALEETPLDFAKKERRSRDILELLK